MRRIAMNSHLEEVILEEFKNNKKPYVWQRGDSLSASLQDQTAIQQKAKQGDPLSLAKLGAMYLPRNPERAYQYFDAAINSADTQDNHDPKKRGSGKLANMIANIIPDKKYQFKYHCLAVEKSKNEDSFNALKEDHGAQGELEALFAKTKCPDQDVAKHAEKRNFTAIVARCVEENPKNLRTFSKKHAPEELEVIFNNSKNYQTPKDGDKVQGWLNREINLIKDNLTKDILRRVRQDNGSNKDENEKITSAIQALKATHYCHEKYFEEISDRIKLEKQKNEKEAGPILVDVAHAIKEQKKALLEEMKALLEKEKVSSNIEGKTTEKEITIEEILSITDEGDLRPAQTTTNNGNDPRCEFIKENGEARCILLQLKALRTVEGAFEETSAPRHEGQEDPAEEPGAQKPTANLDKLSKIARAIEQADKHLSSAIERSNPTHWKEFLKIATASLTIVGIPLMMVITSQTHGTHKFWSTSALAAGKARKSLRESGLIEEANRVKEFPGEKFKIKK